LQFLRGLHFIEGSLKVHDDDTYTFLQFLRGLHFIEGPRCR